MSSGAAVGGALGAAALFAVGTALQYRAVQMRPRSGGAPEGGVYGAVRSTLTSFTWLLGTVILLAGVSLHAFALHEGPLTLVQPLLVTGVLSALLASRFVGGPKVGLVDMRWAAVLVAALAVFLTTATPSSQPARDIDTGPALAALGLSLTAIGACLMVARRCRPGVVATAFGVAAGIALAGSAALMKVCTDLMGHGVANLLSAWQLYALILVGGSALVLSQMAYRAGPMTASVPAINSVNPLASVMIGWAVFDESFRVGTAAVAVEVLSLGLVVAATVILSRRSALRSRPAFQRQESDFSV